MQGTICFPETQESTMSAQSQQSRSLSPTHHLYMIHPHTCQFSLLIFLSPQPPMFPYMSFHLPLTTLHVGRGPPLSLSLSGTYHAHEAALRSPVLDVVTFAIVRCWVLLFISLLFDIWIGPTTLDHHVDHHCKWKIFAFLVLVTRFGFLCPQRPSAILH